MTKEVLQTACMAALMPECSTCLKASHNRDTGTVRSAPVSNCCAALCTAHGPTLWAAVPLLNR